MTRLLVVTGTIPHPVVAASGPAEVLSQHPPQFTTCSGFPSGRFTPIMGGMSTKSRNRMYGVSVRTAAQRAAAARKEAIVSPARPGISACLASEDRRSRRRRSAMPSMPAMAFWKFAASAARPIKLSRSTSSAGRRRRRSTSLNDTCAAATARNSVVIRRSAAISSRCAPPRFRRAIHRRLGGQENDEVSSPWRPKKLAVVVNGMIVPIKPELFPKKGTGERLPAPRAKDGDDYEHAHVKNRGRIGVLV
jgi:hypothetical protein